MSASKPRPEAEIIKWSELTEDQVSAIQQTHALFCAMATQADENSPRTKSNQPALDLFLPNIDKKRGNHVVLIDGQRGTGKTVVMLRLLSEWSSVVRRTKREDPAKDEHGAVLVTDNDPIVPLGVLDLQALSKRAMLGLHLAGHLQRVVEAMEDHAPRSTRHTPWAPGESAELASRKEWRKFLRAAAVAWDGNLKERQGKIDPEAYVIELEQAERERLEILDTFRKFVDALVDDYHEHFHAERKPFFVITIDDADMNPQYTMEVLELTRVLWHPRVGFLIAGDGALFKSVLEEDFKQHKIAPAHAEALARDSYRKAIPPRQRFQTGLPAASRYARIEPLLREVVTKASLPAFGHDLAEYFVLDEQIQDALPGRIRELIDLRQWLRKSIDAKIATPSRFVDRVWRDAFERAEVTREARAFPWVTYHERFDRLDVLQGGWTPDRFVLHTLDIGKHLRGTIYDVARIMPPPGQSQLPDELSPILKLAVNISMHERDRSVNDATGSRLSNPVVLVEFQFIVDGAPFPKSEWDIPHLESFMDYTILLNTWRKHVHAWLNTPNDDPERQFQGVDRLACRFLELVLNHIDRKWRREGNQIHVDVAPTPPHWNDLAERFIKYLSNDGFPTIREKAAREWAQQNVSLLAAPEFGLSATVANAWLEALQSALGDKWEAVRNDLQNRRKGKLAKLGERIDGLSPDYAWTTKVSESDVSRDVDELLRKLSNIVMGHPNGTTWPPNLAGYFIDSRRPSLLAIPKQTLGRIMQLLDQLPSDVAGAEETAVFQIWTIVAPMKEKLSDWVQWDNERSGLKVSLQREDWNIGHGSSSSGHITMEQTSFRWMPEVHKLISPPVDPILRLAWDVAADKLNMYPLNIPMVALWKAKFDGERNWPTPNWMALVDWELFIDAWNRTMKIVAGIRKQNDARRSQRLIDAIGLWFICSIAQLATHRNGRVEFRFELASADWYNLGKNLPHTGPINGNEHGRIQTSVHDSLDRLGARWDAHKAWWDSVVVMAAPESGLSPPAAEAFLNGLYEKHDIKNRPHRVKSDALRLRREHAIRCGTHETQVNKFLTQIDKDNPEHPWHKFFAPEKA